MQTNFINQIRTQLRFLTNFDIKNGMRNIYDDFTYIHAELNKLIDVGI